MTQTQPTEIKTTCAYCGVGCGIRARVEDIEARLVTIQGDEEHPANFGRLCSKGTALGETLGLEERLLYPEIRGSRVSWQRAINEIASRFQAVIDEHGPDAVAFYVSGQLLTEDYYVANKLMKGFIGSANIDTNSRLCMSSSVAGHKRAFGSDTVPGCYEDLELADLIVLTGSNTAWCHPVLFQRVRAAKAVNPNLKVVVIDPRRTDTCDIADLHLPLASGTDTWLFNGLLNFLVQQGKVDHRFVNAHTAGMEQAVEAAARSAPDIDAVAQATELDFALVETFYRWFRDTEKAVTCYSQGVNQSSAGTDKVNSIINCHLVTGRIGRPGMGPFSLTGQPNAMGGREVGGLANQLAAHMDFAADDVERVARFWHAPHMATQPGLKAVDLFDAVHAGKIKALWIMATNPVVSLPNADKVKEALKACEFVVVSDCIRHTDTNRYAQVLLPAVGWGEKDGTVTNSERCISRQRAFLPAPGEARGDWWIVTQVAQAMGWRASFPYQSPYDIFLEHAALSGFENSETQRLRDFNISGLAHLSRADYDALQPVQWPVTEVQPQGTSRLFADGHFYTPDQKARFVAVEPRLPVHSATLDYPLTLNTGRIRDQWHTMTRTSLAPRLNLHKSEPYVEIHPADAARYGIENRQLVQVESSYGQLLARADVTSAQREGSLFVPIHWTAQQSSKSRVGPLVNPVVDPLSGQPEAKHTPARVRPWHAQWQGFLLSRRPLQHLPAEYRVSLRSKDCYRYELAGQQHPPSWSGWAHHNLGHGDLLEADWVEYEDLRAGKYRTAVFIGHRLDSCLFVSSHNDLPDSSWLISQFDEEQPVTTERLSLLAGRPAAGATDCGRTVCACFGVGEMTIRRTIQAQGLSTLQDIGSHLQAGTNCGSCLPELQKLLQTS